MPPWRGQEFTWRWRGRTLDSPACGWSSVTNNSVARPCFWGGCRIRQYRFVCRRGFNVTSVTDTAAASVPCRRPASPYVAVAGKDWRVSFAHPPTLLSFVFFPLLLYHPTGALPPHKRST